MSTSPLVSCLMSAFNAARYLEPAIESIRAQTFSDFEFIIVDDGSTDETPKILDRYAASDQRIRVIRQSNQGLTAALTTAATHARGRFLARMDADDVAEPQRFKRQVESLIQRPHCVAIGSAFSLIDPDGDVLGDHRPPTSHEDIVAQLMRGNGVIAHPTAMFRRDAFQRAGGYNAEFTAAQDLDLWLRLAEFGLLANSPEKLLRYRLHAESVTSQRRELQLACAQLAVRNALRRRGHPQADQFEIRLPQPSSRLRTLRGWARMALKSRRVNVARKHAWSAFRQSPLTPSHWWLLTRAFLT